MRWISLIVWRRWVTRCAVIAMSALGSLAILTPAAHAQVNYPSGCTYYSNGPWQTYCWQGVSYENDSAYTVAVQFASHYLGCGPSTIDGIFGSNTVNAVECFQGKESIGVDGIVGTQTWSYYQANLGQVFYVAGTGYYFNYGTSPYAMFIQCYGSTQCLDDSWWVEVKANNYTFQEMSGAPPV